MTKRTIGTIVAVSIPLVFVGLVAFQLLSSRNDTIEFEPTPVQIDNPRRIDLRENVTFSGNLRPETTANVVPKVSGRILSILVDEGQVVEENQLLAVLDDAVLQLQAQQARAAWEAAESQYAKSIQGARPEEIDNAQASLDQARQELETARVNFERTQNLYEAGTISQSRYEETRSAYTGAQTQVENAERSLNLLREGARAEDIQTARSQAEASLRQYELAQLQVSYAEVRSPVRGRVAAVHSDEGNLAGPGTALFSIISDGTIFARIPVPEGLYGRFYLAPENIEVRVRAIAYPDETAFHGTISRIGSTVDPATRTFEVEVGVENRADLLRPGMYVNVVFTLNTLEDSLVVPSRAVLRRDGQSVVYLFEPAASGNSGTARLARVLPGTEAGAWTQIRDGLTEAELVIVDGNSFLEDGQEVRRVAVEETEAAAEGVDVAESPRTSE